MPTTIGWTDETWNPVTGCTKVSPGCKNCYAEAIAKRFWGDRKFTDVQTHDVRLGTPLKWKRPRMVFVNSMSDLFHEDVPVDFIGEVFRVIERCERHTFQILTKRPERMKSVLREAEYVPPQNAWLGVSVENQETADERIEHLLGIQAAVRFISYEPALGPVDFEFDMPSSSKIHWVIVGGESGPGARPFDVRWARSTIQQCQNASGGRIACFVKQLGSEPFDGEYAGTDAEIVALQNSKGEDPSEWPEELRVQEFPATAATCR